MTILDIIVIAIGLSMDAFAVSICKGLSVRALRPRHALLCGLYFGGFQALMPALGYFLGTRFSTFLERVGGWVTFVLLLLIGINMIRESFSPPETLDDDFSARAMLPLAVATSIDALAVGVSFAALQVSILGAAALIGCITFLLSAVGVKVGSLFGTRYRALAERVGGIVLVLMGFKALL
ncbi:MAG: manganese efflux pump MntP family protein [Gemmiger sp.]|nr:manganese efflux pump MntP family protein [Gemmiger sp.]